MTSVCDLQVVPYPPVSWLVLTIVCVCCVTSTGLRLRVFPQCCNSFLSVLCHWVMSEQIFLCSALTMQYLTGDNPTEFICCLVAYKYSDSADSDRCNGHQGYFSWHASFIFFKKCILVYSTGALTYLQHNWHILQTKTVCWVGDKLLCWWIHFQA